MKAFKNILFPVDLSDISPKLVPYVNMMANQHKADIHLLFVVRNLEHLAGFYMASADIDRFNKDIISGVERRLEEFRSEYFRDFPDTSVKVVIGDISEEIIFYVNNKGIDLLIMGTHGRKGIDRVFFGSIAERVGKTSPVPVLLINPYRESQG